MSPENSGPAATPAPAETPGGAGQAAAAAETTASTEVPAHDATVTYAATPAHPETVAHASPAHPEPEAHPSSADTGRADAGPVHDATLAHTDPGFADTMGYASTRAATGAPPAEGAPPADDKARTDRGFQETMTYPDQARTASPAPAAGPAAGPPADPSAGPGRAGGPQPGGTGTPDLVVRTDTAVLTLRAVGPAAVGRDPGAAVYLEDDRVSWEHAVLRPAGDRWVLEDLGSSNGTFADGEEAARIEITASREIRLGDPAEGPLLRCHLETATGRARAVAGPGSPATGSAPAAPDGPAAEAPKGRFGLRRLGRRR